MASYLQQSGGVDLKIAASELELDFILGFGLYDLIWKEEQLPKDLDYIVCGPQARAQIECPPAAWAASQLVLSVGMYDVYRSALKE